MSYTCVLVPLDGSETARLALDKAVELATGWKARLVLVGVVEIPVAHFEGYGEFIAGLDVHEKLREHIRLALKREVERLAPLGVEVSARVEEGFPPERIFDICLEEKVDLIVMTTHGRRGFAHFLLGSVAERVVRTAPCSVLVVRPPSEA